MILVLWLLGLLALAAEPLPDPLQLELEVGKSVVLDTPPGTTAIAVTDPEVADVVPLTGAGKLQVQGREVGTTDLVVQTGPGEAPRVYQITVHQDLTQLVQRLEELVPGPTPPRVTPLRGRLVLEGEVPDLETLERVALVASLYDEDFVNLLTVRGDHQVQLEVVFAELSRTALRELGLNFLLGSEGFSGGILGPSTGQSPTIRSDLAEGMFNGGIVSGAASAAFQLAGLYSSDLFDFGAILSVLDEHRLSKILAQPTLVTLSGQQGDFLSGGEIPIPTPTGSGQITIQHKEYGIKLVFVPTVLAGEVIDMRVQVEVSEVDYSTGTRLTGVEVPGFISRKGRSHLRVESGMTFAMAGLLSDTIVSTRADIPGLGRIPILGALFRGVRHVRQETELMILVTPRLVRPLRPEEVPALPGTTEDNDPTDLELFFLGRDRHGPAAPGTIGLERGAP